MATMRDDVRGRRGSPARGGRGDFCAGRATGELGPPNDARLMFVKVRLLRRHSLKLSSAKLEAMG